MSGFPRGGGGGSGDATSFRGYPIDTPAPGDDTFVYAWNEGAGTFDLVANGAGGGAPSGAEYLVAVAHAGLSAEWVYGSSVSMRGTLAARPAANTVPAGSRYTGTDNGIEYYGDGAAWNAVAIALGQITGAGTMASVNSPAPIANGGTGQTAADEAFDALAPTTTRGDIVVMGSAGDNVRLALGAAGEALYSDGTDAVWGQPPRRWYEDDGRVISNPTAAEIVYTGGAGVTGPTMDDGGELILRGSGTIQNNTGVSATFSLRLNVGSTLVLSGTSTGLANNANSRRIVYEFHIKRTGTDTRVWGWFFIATAGTTNMDGLQAVGTMVIGANTDLGDPSGADVWVEGFFTTGGATSSISFNNNTIDYLPAAP